MFINDWFKSIFPLFLATFLVNYKKPPEVISQVTPKLSTTQMSSTYYDYNHC